MSKTPDECNCCRTPGNGRRALILKKYFFLDLSGEAPPLRQFVRMGRIWPKITPEDLRNARIEGLDIEIELKTIPTVDKQI